MILHPDNAIMGNAIRVALGKGSFWIDADDWLRLKALPWRYAISGKRPVITRQIKREGKHLNIYIYHDILQREPSRSCPVDHINGDPLDNRRCNLRVCTVSQNAINRPPQAGKLIPYKGVSAGSKNRFVARIKIDGRVVQLGSFERPEDAALSYDRAARRAFGAFAWLNENHFNLNGASHAA